MAFCVKEVMDAILHLLECMGEFRDGDLLGSVDVPASHQKDELVVKEMPLFIGLGTSFTDCFLNSG